MSGLTAHFLFAENFKVFRAVSGQKLPFGAVRKRVPAGDWPRWGIEKDGS
jgi:hypothetical protein